MYKLSYHAHLRRIKRIEQVAMDVYSCPPLTLDELLSPDSAPNIERGERTARLEKLARKQWNANRKSS